MRYILIASAALAINYLTSCNTALPLTNQPTGENCVKLTIEAKTQTKSFYYCDTTGSDLIAERILKHLNVK